MLFLFSFRATNGVVGKVDIVNSDANVEVTKKKRKKRSKKKKTVVQDDDDSDDDEEEETVVETIQTTESKPPQTTLGAYCPRETIFSSEHPMLYFALLSCAVISLLPFTVWCEERYIDLNKSQHEKEKNILHQQRRKERKRNYSSLRL